MKKLEEYATPETEKAVEPIAEYCTTATGVHRIYKGKSAFVKADIARDLERKLAMCRDALQDVLDCISEARGKYVSQAVYNAQEAIKATEPK